MSFNDYVYGINWTMALCTFLIVVSAFTKRDELFFFSGPDGLFTEDVSFGLTRAGIAYIICFTLYSMPYVVHHAYLALKSYSVLTNNQA